MGGLLEPFPDLAIAALCDALVFVGAVNQRLGRFDFPDLAFDVGEPAIVEFALKRRLRVAHRTAPRAAGRKTTPQCFGDFVFDRGEVVVLIKDLKVKGSSITLKMGTKVKSIRLVGGDHEVDCKMDAGNFMLKACFLRKV